MFLYRNGVLIIVTVSELLPDSQELTGSFRTGRLIDLRHNIRIKECQMIVPVEVRTEHDHTRHRDSRVKDNLRQEHTRRNLNITDRVLLTQVTKTSPLEHVLLREPVPVQGHGRHIQNIRMVTVQNIGSVEIAEKHKRKPLANLETPAELAAAHDLMPVFFRQGIGEDSTGRVNFPDKVRRFRFLTGGIITLIPDSIVALCRADKDTSEFIRRNSSRRTAVKQLKIRLANPDSALSGATHTGESIFI